MRTLARAKLNLALRVLAREQSGYHQIETIFCRLELADLIEIDAVPAGIALDVIAADGGPPPELGPVEQNLACRAALVFARETTLAGGVRIRLTKRIPAGGGLGGGSSDAAAVLLALNAMHGEPLARAQLLELGARLGSDVPFFLSGAELALAWGRGERIAPLPPLPPAAVLLAVPSLRIATPAAYAALTLAPPAPRVLELPRSWSDIARAAHNDFEPSIFAMHPQLDRLRQDIAGSGAIVAQMTGTGSVVFGVFEDDAAARAAADRVAAAHPDVEVLLTRTSG